jgi:hypothetical protein
VGKVWIKNLEVFPNNAGIRAKYNITFSSENNIGKGG